MSSSPKRGIRIAIALAVIAGGALVLLRAVPRLVPYAGEGTLRSLEFSRVVLDSKGGEIQVLPLDGGLRRVYVGWREIPPELVRLILRAEDRRFWFHPGVDPASLIRAFIQNRRTGTTVSGASTISMQLARIITPRPRKFSSKLIEAWEALQLESRLGKRGVLTLYVNLLPFGQNAEGFQTAATVFFGRPLVELTSEELMILTVMPRSPEEYNPYANAKSSREAVLRLAAARGVADDAGFEERLGRAYRSVEDPSRTGIWPFRAPQFVEFLRTRPEWKGWDGRKPVRTTLEPELQSYLEFLLAREVEKAAPKRITNGAALFVRPKSMSVAAYVGSVDFSDTAHSGQIDGVQIRRQPGSTLKPFLYSLALEHGFTASTILPDIPSDFGSGEVYVPSNFNNQFNGPVRLRQALASSLNVPAVYTLERVGVLPFTDLLIADGVDSLAAQRGSLGLGLALGNAEVRLWELVQGYALFLADGRPVRLSLLADSRAPSTRPLVDPRVARLVRDLLTRYPDRTLTFGQGGNTRLTFEGAMKTGTSSQFNNIWAVGFTPDLLGGVWMGNFSGDTVFGAPGSGIPAGVLAKVLEDFSSHPSFPGLTGLVQARICTLSGELATDACPHTMDEWFLPGTEPGFCTWHVAGPGGIETHYPQLYQSWL
ncbi:MAG TPA: transglycosylase domain-containing protein, partial [Spirochaetia bacterium]|nr:transglycosylase domain-containing protein [Spirochaetia bacterium]